MLNYCSFNFINICTSKDEKNKEYVEGIGELWDAIIFFLLKKHLHAVTGRTAKLQHSEMNSFVSSLH